MSIANESINDLLRNAGRGQVKSMLRRLDEFGDVNIANKVGYTPLMAASRNLRYEIVELLLKRGANVNARTIDTQATALHAVVGGSVQPPLEKGQKDTRVWQVKCIELLVNYGADSEAKDYMSMTPLMHASWFGCDKAAIALLTHMSHVNHIDEKNGQTAQEIAESRGHEKLAQIIANHGSSQSFLSKLFATKKSK